MPLFHLKGEEMGQLAPAVGPADKFARKLQRSEAESRLAGYKYRNDIIAGISQVLSASGCFLIGLEMELWVSDMLVVLLVSFYLLMKAFNKGNAPSLI